MFDSRINAAAKIPNRVPVLINYSVGKVIYEKKPDENDLEIIKKVDALEIPLSVPIEKLPNMQMANVGRVKTTNTKYLHDFFLPRQAQAMGLLWEKVNDIDDKNIRHALLWSIEQSIPGMSILNRYQPIMHGRPGGSQVNRQMSGVFYVPSQISECSPWYNLSGKIGRVTKAFKQHNIKGNQSLINTGDCSSTSIPSNSIEYIFTDPPFGENIYYSDLNLITEAWHKVKTDTKPEAIVDRVKSKDLFKYHALMEQCFKEYYRVLKPGRWITVEFSNTKASVWNGIQTALSNAGFIVANVSALNKKQGTFQAVNSSTAVKQDLVISAYKPSADFEKRFENESLLDGVWDFIRNHLTYIPLSKQQENELIVTPERDPCILFDQVVSYFVRHGRPVPISSPEFQAGLVERFVERDGMIFLPDQVAEYDKKRVTAKQLRQMSIFVDDEASAIEWLRQQLSHRPITYQDIHPLFLNALSGWKKNEKQLELRDMLEQNFLQYDGKDEVPSQIHSYLSTDHKDMRNLAKTDPKLVAKAKDRWFVPDPNKAGDLERLRERSLLKEFETYKQASKKIKQPRGEALRAGFKKAWEVSDFQQILDIAEKIPAAVLQEDEKLLMYYDNAKSMGGDDDFDW